MNKYKYLIATSDEEKQVTIYAVSEEEAEAIANGMAKQLSGGGDYYVGLITASEISLEAFEAGSESVAGSACFAGLPELEGGGADESQND